MNLPRAGQSQPKGRIRPAGRKMPRSGIMHQVKQNVENSVYTKKDLHSGPSVTRNLEK